MQFNLTRELRFTDRISPNLHNHHGGGGGEEGMGGEGGRGYCVFSRQATGVYVLSVTKPINYSSKPKCYFTRSTANKYLNATRRLWKQTKPRWNLTAELLTTLFVKGKIFTFHLKEKWMLTFVRGAGLGPLEFGLVRPEGTTVTSCSWKGAQNASEGQKENFFLAVNLAGNVRRIYLSERPEVMITQLRTAHSYWFF